MSEELKFQVTKEMVDRFALLSGDSNPLHTDEIFARRSPYRRQIVHGMLPVLFLSKTKPCCAEKNHGIKKISARFLRPVFFDEPLCLRTRSDLKNPGQLQSYAFEILNVRTGAAVTTGIAEWAHSSAESEGQTDKSRTVDFSLKSVLAEAPSESDRTFEEIKKGDCESVDFVFFKEHARELSSILSAGIGAPSSRSSNDMSSFLICGLFSAFVGMRLPGRHATFMDFNYERMGPIKWGELYAFSGEVDFKSASTQTISEKVRITAGGGETIMTGKINCKVNTPPILMPSMESLSKSETGLNLRGKVVLITGASRGIGETTAKLFSVYGAKIAVNYHKSKSDGDRVVDEIRSGGGEAAAFAADVTDRAQVKNMIDAVMREFGTVDVLVNNAASDANPVPFMELSWQDVERDLEITVKGAFNCCQEVLAHMTRRRSGKIINVSSVYADNPPTGMTKYVVAKNALAGLTRSLAVEFASENIQINAVVPSLVETDLSKHVPKMFLESMKNSTPMKRHATPVDVANAILYLASPLASFTTGQKLLITGGNAPFL